MEETIKKALAEYALVWNNDPKMMAYHERKISACYETEQGRLIEFESPSIETHFCVGYGLNGMSTEKDYEAASKAAKAAIEKESFIANNMRCFKDIDAVLNDGGGSFVIPRKYCSCDRSLNLSDLHSEAYLRHFESARTRAEKITEKDLSGLKTTLESEKAKFRKRLETYWKRYGSTKLKTRTYLVD